MATWLILTCFLAQSSFQILFLPELQKAQYTQEPMHALMQSTACTRMAWRSHQQNVDSGERRGQGLLAGSPLQHQNSSASHMRS